VQRVRAALEELRARGWKLAILSNTDRDFIDASMKSIGVPFEQAIVANATGMRVARRGMIGPTVEPGTHVRDAVASFPPDELLAGPGIVDYVVGADPAPGVFVLGVHEDPAQRHYLDLYKLGEGPFYCF